MAFIDLCSAGSYGSFNRKLARITNITTAVYWAEILEISKKVVKKVTYDENGYFPVDREYVEQMCAVPLEDQLTCDAILEQLKVIKRNPADLNSMSIDLAAFSNLIVNEDTKKLDIPKDPTKITREQKSANKKEIIKATMKRCIHEDDEDLKSKYFEWVDSVYDAGRFLNKAKITIFQEAVNNFSQDKQVKLNLVTSAVLSGYDNPDWVINSFTKNNKSIQKPVAVLPEQKIANDVKTFNYF